MFDTNLGVTVLNVISSIPMCIWCFR